MPPKDEQASKANNGTFISTIAAMNHGQVTDDLDDALRECTKAAIGAAAKAKITLELTIIPNGEGIGGTPLVKIVDKIKVSVPKPKRDKEPVFFADEDFNPSRRNPRQEEMKLTAMEGGLPGAAAPQGESKVSGQ